MSEIIANWTKLVVGVCVIMVVVGYVTGHVSSDDFKYMIGAALGIHATTSGLAGIIGGPTLNSEVKK